MAENILSCFIDEAGDFGDFEAHSPYYIVSVIAHEQSNSIQAEIDGLERYLSGLGYAHHAIQTYLKQKSPEKSSQNWKPVWNTGTLLIKSSFIMTMGRSR
ncbi:MAG: hypothetical protein IJ558_06110 [Treponema sp.]|nr:hypothetical protein [Treponema sp.]